MHDAVGSAQGHRAVPGCPWNALTFTGCKVVTVQWTPADISWQMDDRREGFELEITDLSSVDQFAALGQQANKAFTICSLFLNENCSITEIGVILNETRQNIILTLLEYGILKERRSRPRLPGVSDERGH
jgi:hypothetical protein